MVPTAALPLTEGPGPDRAGPFRRVVARAHLPSAGWLWPAPRPAPPCGPAGNWPHSACPAEGRREGRELWVCLGDLAIDFLGVLTTNVGGGWAQFKDGYMMMASPQTHFLLAARTPPTPPSRQTLRDGGQVAYQAVPIGFCFGDGFLNGLFSHP